MEKSKKLVEYLIVDTTAFIQNVPLHEIAEHILTCKEVVDEVTSKRQLRNLVVLPYNLIVKDVFTENIKFVTEFSKKTGDYPSLSATDIKVMALTYQLQKEKNGVDKLRIEPVLQKPAVTTADNIKETSSNITGFFLPKNDQNSQDQKTNDTLTEDLILTINDSSEFNSSSASSDAFCTDRLQTLSCNQDSYNAGSSDESSQDEDSGWINPHNIKNKIDFELIEEKQVYVACMTTDFAMQNVLRQINLNVSALDGRLIKHLRTYILRCYACFKTTSIMTKKFCPKCGNNTLKKVAVSLNENGETQIHINPRRPLTGRGKIFSLPKIKGGKHPNNPILVEDQPTPDNKPSRLAKTKNNPLNEDYIAGFSPFVVRDVNSKSAHLCIRPGSEFKQWMKRNPNESKKKKK